MAVEKRVTSTLLESSSIEKVMEVDSHIGVAMSGLIADSRIMIDHARVEAQVRYILNETKYIRIIGSLMMRKSRLRVLLKQFAI